MNIKILLFGVGLGGNYGIDAIAIGTERILRRYFADSQIWLPGISWRKEEYRKELGIHSGITIKNDFGSVRLEYIVRRIIEKVGLTDVSTVRIFKKLVQKADCVLSIGGDLYTFANKEKNWPFPYSIVEAGNKIISQGKPYVIWCASVGPLEKSGDRLNEIIEHLQNCTAIILRERDSYIYLRETLGIKDNVYLAADPAFVMEPEEFELPFVHMDDGNKTIAINFSRAPIEHVFGENNIDSMNYNLVGCVQYLLEHLPVRVLFVPHVGGDHAFLTPIFDELNRRYFKRISILPKDIGARKTKWAISQANALVTMRFHCSLAGFSTCTPTLVLLSTSKGRKICKEIYGDLENSLNIKEMNAESLFLKIRNLLENEEQIRGSLAQISEEMNARAFSAGEILSSVL